MTRTRVTHIFAELEVSSAAYDEIRGLLREAGYQHAFLEGGTIDMNGIGLRPRLSTREAIARASERRASAGGFYTFHVPADWLGDPDRMEPLRAAARAFQGLPEGVQLCFLRSSPQPARAHSAIGMHVADTAGDAGAQELAESLREMLEAAREGAAEDDDEAACCECCQAMLAALGTALDGDDMYGQTPAELVYRLRDQRDEARAASGTG